jgi:hypothetical protein
MDQQQVNVEEKKGNIHWNVVGIFDRLFFEFDNDE